MNRLIYVSKGYIQNLGPLGPLLRVEKFVVGGGGWVVVEADFSVKLEPQAEQLTFSLLQCYFFCKQINLDDFNEIKEIL